MTMNGEPVHYKHDEIIYVPVFWDTEENTFVYSLADGSHDEQMAWSCGPDYVLTLSGTFDAWTPDRFIYDHGQGD